MKHSTIIIQNTYKLIIRLLLYVLFFAGLAIALLAEEGNTTASILGGLGVRGLGVALSFLAIFQLRARASSLEFKELR